MNRKTTAAVVSVAALCAAGASAYAYWSGEPATVHALCSPDLSRPEYVATFAHQVAIGTVTERVGYKANGPGRGDDQGGVILSKFTVDRALKGEPPAVVTLAQAARRQADGSFTTYEPQIQVLEPGQRYTVAIGKSVEEGGMWVWGADRIGGPGAVSQEEAWVKAVDSRTPIPEPTACDDVIDVS
ncbi:hypothetical protein OG429_03905 [Streptomyces sp. NBC_00190]|uniref:hypothetical protein n=1 Tax=unclassified Streptomyces TaxID=2593676 RepID=UPI002E28EFA9|nr:hypothetical protein [Streptomyces sp. NBC_00190]WSZ38541.1 hypothetical protein OG239_06910 [Streptomyces sp. NBC_00868]